MTLKKFCILSAIILPIAGTILIPAIKKRIALKEEWKEVDAFYADVIQNPENHPDYALTVIQAIQKYDEEEGNNRNNKRAPFSGEQAIIDAVKKHGTPSEIEGYRIWKLGQTEAILAIKSEFNPGSDIFTQFMTDISEDYSEYIRTRFGAPKLVSKDGEILLFRQLDALEWKEVDAFYEAVLKNPEDHPEYTLAVVKAVQKYAEDEGANRQGLAEDTEEERKVILAVGKLMLPEELEGFRIWKLGRKEANRAIAHVYGSGNGLDTQAAKAVSKNYSEFTRTHFGAPLTETRDGEIFIVRNE